MIIIEESIIILQLIGVEKGKKLMEMKLDIKIESIFLARRKIIRFQIKN